MNDDDGFSLLRNALIWELEYEADHQDEFFALRAARDGNATHLANLLREKGLATSEARAFAASMLRGEKKRGRPATSTQWEKEVQAFSKVFAIMFKEGVGLEKAVDLCVEADPDLVDRESTFRTHARRGQKKFAGLLNAYMQRHLQRTQKK